MKLLNRNNIYILVHAFCWLILALGVLYSHPNSPDITITNGFWIRQTDLLIILMGVFYFNYYVLIPGLLIRRKVIIYILVVIALLVGVTCLNSFINSTFHLNPFVFNHPRPEHNGPGGPGGHRDRHGPFGFETYVPGLNLLMIGLGITISFIQKWQQEVNLRQQLEQEKTATELTLLKAQINPHFFFNTLNTIYSYTLSDGDIARTAITNLSKMMRYVLYDAAGLQTPLNKEIAFIKEYVELMKLRISAKTTVLLQVQEGMGNAMIAPMLFLPFVENAFKHGVSGVTEGQISIWIIHTADKVELIVRNTVYETRRESEDDSNGIGILNTTRRLDLLYPEKYTLTAGLVANSEYEVKLKLTL
ncbi:histidine kinase [Mucilaginibacter sp. HMF5004]|uniref:sensor histidine kinase n=1 Tax=Mucilaginibacter rivuli TaxID=2857527 RepID=UPI001C5D9AD8|nr:histidine kinase [Mucilaginibacter rivuli]MBW4889977.1 histidine kinase [Mucilaginibacter rivuli]